MFDVNELTESYSKTCTSWGIQASINGALTESEYPITGEEINNLERKELANFLVDKRIGIEHSRLALKSQISGNLCSFDSNCFVGCDQDVPYKPSLQIHQLQRNFQFDLIHGKLLRFDLESKSIFLENGLNLHYQKLYLSTGVRATLEILKKSQQEFADFNYLSSSVEMRPIFIWKKSSEKDFYKSFLYTDLVCSISIKKSQAGLIQIYLPTHEIASRILSTIPKALVRFLEYYSRIVENLLKHVGIIMLFHPGTEKEDSERDIRKRSTELIGQIRKKWLKSGVLVLWGPKKYLLNEQTMHMGALGTMQDLRGVDNPAIKLLSDNSVYICDTSLLPSLPPGPVTAVAAAYTRVIVSKAQRAVD